MTSQSSIPQENLFKTEKINVQFTFSLEPEYAASWSASELAAVTGGTWTVQPSAGWTCRGFGSNRVQCFPGTMLISQPDKPLVPTPGIYGVMYAASEVEPDLSLPKLQVPNTSDTLFSLARHARKKFSGKVIAVTGSAGKTSTVYALAKALNLYGQTEYSRGSGNVPQAVARTIASISQEMAYWVLELSMVRMRSSSALAKPDIAIVTSIFEAHLSDLKNLAGVAKQKSLIFTGMLPESTAILNRDMSEYAVVENAAKQHKLNVFTYGQHPEADVRLLENNHGVASVNFMGRILDLSHALSQHSLENFLAIMLCLHILKLPLESSYPLMHEPSSLPGRGRVFKLCLRGKDVTLLDESYNANTGSMIAALQHFKELRQQARAGVAFLGEIADLGEAESDAHMKLVPTLLEVNPERLVLCGLAMQGVWEAVREKINACWYETPENLIKDAHQWIKDGDAIVVKSSGHKLQRLVQNLIAEHNSLL